MIPPHPFFFNPSFLMRKDWTPPFFKNFENSTSPLCKVGGRVPDYGITDNIIRKVINIYYEKCRRKNGALRNSSILTGYSFEDFTVQDINNTSIWIFPAFAFNSLKILSFFVYCQVYLLRHRLELCFCFFCPI